METDNPSFFKRIDAIYSSLTTKQARIADHLRTQYRKAVFYTLLQAAEATCVSEASIIRFARMLGYGGFSDMQDAIKAYVTVSMRTTVERFQALEASSGASAGWEQLLESTMRTLQSLPLLIEADAVDKFAEAMSRFTSIMIVGFESTAGFADYLAYYLSRAGLPAELITERTGNLFPSIRRSSQGTLIISIMVARYPRQAVHFCKACSRRGATVAIISDTADHPLRDVSSFQFSVATRRSDGMNLEIQVSLFTMLQLLILKTGMHDVSRTRSSLAELEDYDTAFSVFD